MCRLTSGLTALLFLVVSTPVSAQPLPGYWDARFSRPDAGGAGFEDFVNVMATDPLTGDVYAGGRFREIDGTHYIARWTGDAWAPVGGGVNNQVHAIEFDGAGNMFVGGAFTRVYQSDGATLEAPQIARWDGASWHILDGGPSNDVFALEYDPDSGWLYVGGDFDEVVDSGGSIDGSANIIAWDGSGWRTLGRGGLARFAHAVYVLAADPNSDRVYVGGQFFSRAFNPDGTEVVIDNLAYWDGSAWQAFVDMSGYPQDLKFDTEGRLYAVGQIFQVDGIDVGHIARFDGTTWEGVGGGIADSKAEVILLEDGGAFVGGNFDAVRQPDGTEEAFSNVAYIDFATNQWHDLGGTPSPNRDVRALAFDGDDVFMAGYFLQAGARPARFASRWITSERDLATTLTTFSVDMTGLRDHELFGVSDQPIIEIRSGALAGPYYLYDPDRDAIYTTTIELPAGATLPYLYVHDRNEDAFDDGDWVRELDPPNAVRNVSIPSGGTFQVPTVVFDEGPSGQREPGFVAENRHWRDEGSANRGRFSFDDDSPDAWYVLDFIDRLTGFSVLAYMQDPGGAPPSGTTRVADHFFWRVELWPKAADYAMDIEWELREVAGVRDPESLRMLHRSSPEAPWEIVPTEVDLVDNVLRTPDVRDVRGDWTLASTSNDNLLTALQPGTPALPSPGDGSLRSPTAPVMSWSSLDGAEYEIFVWRQGETRPDRPTDDPIEATYTPNTLEAGSWYEWQVIAHNLHGSATGPIWSFRVGPGPDLTVGSVSALGDVFSGQKLDMSWTVQNIGPAATDASQWLDVVYISEGSSFDPEAAVLLARFPNLAYLGPGESYVATESVTLPEGIQGAHRLYVVTDGLPADSRRTDPVYRALVEEDETNNVGSSGSIPVTLTPYADLEVVDIDVVSNAFSGSQLEVTYTIRNQGDGQTNVGSWYDAVFLSDDDVFDYNFTLGDDIIRFQDPFLGSTEHSGAVEPGAEYTATVRVDLPDDAIGDHWLFVAADTRYGDKEPERGLVYEFNQEFDNWTPEPISITLTPPPDLTVTSVSGPPSGVSGEPVVVSWTVTNEGPGETARTVWRDLVYYSPTATFDPSTAVRLASYTHSGRLASDESYTNTIEVELPDGISGPAWFHVLTDSNREIFEYTYEDNNRSAGAVSTSVTRAPYPDLAPDALQLSTPTPTAGDEIVLQYTIRNLGDAAVPGRWTDSVFVSSSADWNRAEAVAVAGVERDTALEPGQSTRFTLPIVVPPSVSGDVYLHVRANARDDIFEYPDDGNDVQASAGLGVSAYPPVDLAGRLTIPDGTVDSGDVVRVTGTVTNVGQASTVSTGWTDRIYLSDDTELDPAQDVLLTEYTRTAPLQAGESYEFGLRLEIPDGLDGDHHLLLDVDADDQVDEIGTTPNLSTTPIVLSLPPGPDLRMTNLSAPASARSGEPVLIEWTVANTGDGPTRGGPWFDAVYLSSDLRIGPDDALLGRLERTEPLADGGSYTAQLRTAFPAYAAGRLYVLGSVDSRDDVYEHLAEGNNQTRVEIDLELPNATDLVVEDVSAPGSAMPGQSVEVSWLTRNAGDHPAAGLVREGIFVSDDAAWSPDDLLLAVVEREIDLAPGAAAKRTARVDVAHVLAASAEGATSGLLPGVGSGTYHTIVRTDMRNVVRETDVANNATASTTTVQVSVPSIASGASTELTLSPGDTRYFQIDVPPGADVLVTTAGLEVGTSGVELFVAHGQIPNLATCCAADADILAGIEPFQVNQEVVLTDTDDGPYYVVVRHPGTDAADVTVDVSSEVLEFGIRQVSREVVGPGPIRLLVQGSNFSEGSRVVVRDSEMEVSSDSVRFEDRTMISPDLDLTGMSPGEKEVIVVEAGVESAPYAGRFEVSSVRSETSALILDHPEAVRSAQTIEVEVILRNTGNTSLLDYMLWFEALPEQTPCTGGGPSPESGADDLEIRAVVPLEFGGEVGPMSVKLNDGVYVMPVWIMSMAPGGTDRISVRVRHNLFRCWKVKIEASLVALPASEYTRTGSMDDIESSFGFRLISDAMYEAYQEQIGLQVTQTSGFAGKQDVLDQHVDPVKEAMDVHNKRWTDRVDAATPFSSLHYAAIGALGAAILIVAPPIILGGTVAWGTAIAAATIGAMLGEIVGDMHSTAPWLAGFGINARETRTAYQTCHLVRDGAADELEWLRDECESSTDDGEVLIETPQDPNDILGPPGFGPEKFVSSDRPMSFKIRYENDPEQATAPAQTVEIRQRLDPAADVRSFRLGDFGFGSHVFSPPENRSFYQTRVDVTDSLGVSVDVTAGIDVTTRQAFWILRSVDPATGEAPADPYAGFLPVNDDWGRGEGFVDYRIVPSPESATGDVLDSEASIVFDLNPPIDTPPIFHTIDADPPVSAVNVLTTRQDSVVFDVSWTGQDAGVGVRDFTLYASKEGEPFEPVGPPTAKAQRLFVGEWNTRYRFFTIATDHVGNVEPMKTEAEAVTAVANESEAELPTEFALHQNFPNPFNPTTTIPFDLAGPGEVEIALYDVIGRRVLSIDRGRLTAGRYQQIVDLSQLASGVYFYQLMVRSERSVRFRDVGKLVLVK